jgi:hypothetical protein
MPALAKDHRQQWRAQQLALGDEEEREGGQRREQYHRIDVARMVRGQHHWADADEALASLDAQPTACHREEDAAVHPDSAIRRGPARRDREEGPEHRQPHREHQAHPETVG